MKPYLKAVFIGGVVIPIVLHVVASDRMPWWPDTVAMGIGFGAFGLAMVWKAQKDREMNHRLWTALKACGAAIGRHFDSDTSP
jgi:phosphotransferase system  glucose/maltose/N-acetylglucosamine-specific IIC component